MQQDITRRQALVGAAGVVGAGLLAGCGSSGGSGTTASGGGVPVAQRRRGGVIRVAGSGSGSSETLDPVSYVSGNINNCRFIAIYDRLVRMGPNITPQLELAESFEPNADATEWTIRLHRGVEWHDGKPFTAKDVLYSFNRLNDPRYPNYVGNKVALANFRAAKVMDDVTLRVPMHQSFSGFMETLTYGFWVVQDGMKDFTKTAVGTGPYRVQSFSPGEVCVVVPNANYWGSVGPFADRMELRSIADVQARVNAFQAGELDVAMDLGSEASRLAAGLPGHIVTSQKLTAFYFQMDMSRKPFDDPRVVRAFKLACDREAMNANLQNGRGVVGQDLFFMAPGSEGYPSDWPTPPYDPDQAKRLLAEAGYADGISITMEAISGYPDMINLCQLYAQQAKAAGIDVKVNATPEDKFYSDVWGKTSFFGDYGGPNVSSQVLAGRVTGNGNNVSNFSSAQYDKDFAALERATTKSARAPIYARLVDELRADGTLTPLWFNGYDLVSEQVQGWEPANSLWARQDIGALAIAA
jgi:peptide/nickel transport system substrate-binding protein